MARLPFRDRAEAGQLLGCELARRNLEDAIVLGLPRGGVVVASQVAETLNTPLDILVVRKLGVPWHGELAMGALAGETVVVDQEMVRELGVTEEELGEVIAKERHELQRRETVYRCGRAGLLFARKTVVLVDDGLATGSTMLAAVRHARSKKPQKLVVAVPVASHEARELIRGEADEVVCLVVPEAFRAVGEWYQNFRQTSDEEVCRLLLERGS